MDDVDNWTRNQCISAINDKREDVRSSKAWAKSTGQQRALVHLSNAVHDQGDVVALCERRLQIERAERDALSIALQRATLEGEEKGAGS